MVLLFEAVKKDKALIESALKALFICSLFYI